MFRALDKWGLSAYYTETNSNDNIIDISVQFGLEMMAKGGHALTRDNTRWENVLRRINLICMAILTIGCIMALIDKSTTLSDYIELMKTIAALIQVFGRFCILLFYKTPLIQLINDSLLFWRIEDLLDNEKAKYLNFYQLQSRVYQIFLICIALTVCCITLQPFFGSLPLYIWIPSNNILIFWLASIIDVIAMYTLIFLVIGFDLTFVSICNNVTIQFKLLQSRIAEVDYGQLNTNEINRKITDLIKYHIFLLNYIEKIQKSFIFFFFIQYTLTTIASCANVAMILIGHLSVLNICQGILYLITLQIEFSFYCIPLAEISTEARNVGDAVFHSEWYQGQGNGHKVKLLLMLMRAQKDCEFSVGGLTKMNRETIIKVFRLCLSVATAINTIQSKV